MKKIITITLIAAVIGLSLPTMAPKAWATTLDGHVLVAGNGHGGGNGGGGNGGGHGGGNGGGGHGPGDGTGNGTGPKDGTGNGPRTGDCVNQS